METETSEKVLHLPSTASELPASWKWRRLDDVCEGIFDCPHSTPKLTLDGLYVVRSQDMRSGVFRLEEAGRVSEETYLERIKRVEPRYGDLLYSREGTYFGIAAEVPRNIRVCLGQRMVLIRPKAKYLNFRFLRYWLNSPVLAAHIYGHRDGTVAERLNLPTIRGLPVPVAPLVQQQAIAHILGTIDDKIELNQQMNHTLEAIARALFKSWFIDFDPVRAKMDGRQPAGMDAETAALFPAEFEDSLLGKIPKGWKVGKLSEFIKISRTGINPSGFPNEIFAHYSLPAFDEGKMPKLEIGEQIRSNKFLLTEKVVLLSKLNPHIPRIWFPCIRGEYRSICSTEFLVISPFQENSCQYLYSLFSSQIFLDLFSSLVTGTSGSHQRVKPEYLVNLDILSPPQKLISQFTQITKSAFERVNYSLFESKTLRDTRDTLLPKLLSGEIRIKDAEKVVEEVA